MFENDLNQIDSFLFNEEEVKDTIFDYKKFIVSENELNGKLKDYLTGKIKKGYGINKPLLDNVIVCKTKEMFACVGKKGRGKTTIQQIFFLMWAMVNDLVFVLCLQENDTSLSKKDLLGYLLGCKPSDALKNDLELYNKAVKWLDEHFIFLRDIDSFKQATEVTEAIISDGKFVQALFLDPANTFESGWFDGGSWADEKKTAKKLLKFAKKTCSLYLSQHPTMSAQRREGDVHSADAEGGHLLNKSDFTWVVNRDNGSSQNRITVDNVRNKYTGGGITHPENPLILHWQPYNIDLEHNGQKEMDIIQKIRYRYNPLKEIFINQIGGGFKEKTELPKPSINEAFGTGEYDVPF